METDAIEAACSELWADCHELNEAGPAVSVVKAKRVLCGLVAVGVMLEGVAKVVVVVTVSTATLEVTDDESLIGVGVVMVSEVVLFSVKGN